MKSVERMGEHVGCRERADSMGMAACRWDARFCGGEVKLGLAGGGVLEDKLRDGKYAGAHMVTTCGSQ